jgi:CheY-like chemotaxis protein
LHEYPDLADKTGGLLRSHGLHALAAYSGQEALGVLESDDEIEAVFPDFMMPEMTGLQLADVGSERYPRIKIVLTSGYTSPSLRWPIDLADCGFKFDR